MKDVSAKKIVTCSLCLLIGIVLLLSLCFYTISIGTKLSVTTTELSSLAISEKGFDYLGFSSPFIDLLKSFVSDADLNNGFAWYTLVFGILAWLVIATSIATIVFAIVGFFCFSANESKKANVICTIIALSLAFLLLAASITVCSVFSYNLDLATDKLFSAACIIKTYTYWPLIIIALLSIALFVFNDKMPNSALVNEENKDNDTNKNERKHGSINFRIENETIDLLIRYKDLLDKDIINQDEFNKIKQRLLHLD